jgi:hypothetical protein
MKKRVLSMLLAFVITVSVIPVVTVSVSAQRAPYAVEFVAREGERMITGSLNTHYRSEPILITGEGTYKGVITFDPILADAATGELFDEPFRTRSLVGLNIQTAESGLENSSFLRPLCRVDCDGVSAPRPLRCQGPTVCTGERGWNEYVIRVKSIIVNDRHRISSNMEDYFVNRAWPPALRGYVIREFYNGWWDGNHFLQNEDGSANLPTEVNIDTDDSSKSVTFPFLAADEYLDKMEIEFELVCKSSVAHRAAEENSAEVQLIAREAEDFATLLRPYRGQSVTITGNGSYSATLNDIRHDRLTGLALVSSGAVFHGGLPFRGKAQLAPESWSDATIKIDSVMLGGSNRLIAYEDLLVSYEEDDWSCTNPICVEENFADCRCTQPYPYAAGYIDISLWNAWHDAGQNLTAPTLLSRWGDEKAIAIADGTAIGNITVNFTVSGIPEEAQPCDCGLCSCEECGPCGLCSCATCGPCGTCAVCTAPTECVRGCGVIGCTDVNCMTPPCERCGTRGCDNPNCNVICERCGVLGCNNPDCMSACPRGCDKIGCTDLTCMVPKCLICSGELHGSTCWTCLGRCHIHNDEFLPCEVCNPIPCPRGCGEGNCRNVNCMCDCKNCTPCGFLGGKRGFGRVTGGSTATVDDAIEILKYVVGLENVIAGSSPANLEARAAAAITAPGSAPKVDDAIEILKFVVGLDNELQRKKLW